MQFTAQRCLVRVARSIHPLTTSDLGRPHCTSVESTRRTHVPRESSNTRGLMLYMTKSRLARNTSKITTIHEHQFLARHENGRVHLTPLHHRNADRDPRRPTPIAHRRGTSWNCIPPSSGSPLRTHRRTGPPPPVQIAAPPRR